MTQIADISPSSPSTRSDGSSTDDNEDNLDFAERIIAGCNSEDEQVKLKYVMEIRMIASSMDAETIRSVFLPFLSNLEGKSTEVINELIEVLKDSVNLIGGMEYADALFPLIRSIYCNGNDSSKKAVLNAVEDIVALLTPTLIDELLKPYCQRLSEATNESTRIFVVSFSMVAMRRAAVLKMEDGDNSFKEIYFKLWKDSDVTVRCAAVNALSEYAQILIANHVNDKELLKCFQMIRKLLHAEMNPEPVRIAAVAATCAVSEVLVDLVKLYGLPMIRYFSVDVSWKVRWAVANSLHRFTSLLSADDVEANLFYIFRNLLKDRDMNVQTAAFRKLPTMIATLKHPESDIFDLRDYLKSELDLINASTHLRLAIVEALLELPQVTEAPPVKHVLLECLIKMMDDNHYMVICKILDGIPVMAKYVGTTECLSAVIDFLQSFSSHINWRVRAALSCNIRYLFDKTVDNTSVDAPSRELYDMLIGLLNDEVHAVRAAAGKTFCLMVKDGILKDDKLVTRLLQSMSENSRYAIRIDFLGYVVELAGDSKDVSFVKQVMRWIEALISDTVPSVRVNVCKAIFHLKKKWENSSNYVDLLDLWLERLADDSDEDTRYFSKLCCSEITHWPQYTILESEASNIS